LEKRTVNRDSSFSRKGIAYNKSYQKGIAGLMSTYFEEGRFSREESSFSISEAWRSVFHSIKRNLVFYFTAMLILLLPLNIFYYVQRTWAHRGTNLYMVTILVGLLLIIVISVCFIQIGLRFASGEKAGFADLRTALHNAWRYLLGFLIYYFIILGGFLLLIVPGIIWAVKYQFFGYFVIDQGMRPSQAVSRSGQITRGESARVFFLDLTFFVLQSLAVWTIWFLSKTASQIVGSILFPRFLFALAYVYKKLLATEAIQPEDMESTETATAEPDRA